MTNPNQSEVQPNPLVSIIIPLYNAEKGLERCIDSILKQSYQNFELILVDDGSEDSSAAICDKYAGQDSRIRVFHKDNSGVSDSRNLAMKQAKGAWLQFVDADDWIAPEATGLLVTTATAHGCDMVISDFYRVIDNRIAHKGDIQEEGILSKKEFASCMMEKPADYYYGVLWNKLYKKEIIEQYQLHMDSDVSWCEDFMFNLEYICHIQNVYVLRVPLYYYVRTKNSLSSQGMSLTKTIQMKTTVFEYYHKFYKEVFGENDHEKSRLQVYRFLLDAANDGIVPPSLIPGSLKLGEERIRVNPDFIEHDDSLLELYLKKKCLEACLQSVAFRYDLQMDELYMLLCLDKSKQSYTRKELIDLIGCTRRRLSVILQNLKFHSYISWTEHTAVRKDAEQSRKTKTLEIRLLPDAEPVLENLRNARNNYQQICFSGFTPEEFMAYEAMRKRIHDNISRTLL